MKYKIFTDILLLIGAIYLFIMCSNTNKATNNNITNSDYNISHYVDTIYGHMILTTVCDGIHTGFISVTTLEIKDTNKINNN